MAPPPPPPPPLPRVARANGARAPPPPPPPPPPSLQSHVPTMTTLPPPPPPPPPTLRTNRLPPPPPPPPPHPLGSPSTFSTTIPPPPPQMYMSNLPPPPPVAPSLPETPRASEQPSPPAEPKFPSFTMDLDTPDLQDITNTRHSRSHRNSVYRSSIPDQFQSTLTSQDETIDSFAADPQDKPWDRPIDFGTMSQAPTTVDEDEEDDHLALDVPDRLTVGPGAAAARLDLHRCTIRVHQELIDQIKTNSMTSPAAMEQNQSSNPSELSRCQGELWLKSRVPMLGWKKRYGSIVDHSYFGPVLFLFKYDAKGNVALHHSTMIVLVDSSVRLGKNSTTKDRDFRCEFVLKTTKRRYLIAANHTMRRDYWLRHLETIQAQASTMS